MVLEGRFMVRRLTYTALTGALVLLVILFATRLWGRRQTSLPNVELPRELSGLSCPDALARARMLTRQPALERARVAYLWIVGHCDDPTVLADGLLETGALLGYLMQRPNEARRAYGTFLQRFPGNAGTAEVTYNLARLEIDGGDYAAAVAHLTELAQRFPNSEHEASAKFLAGKAAEMLAADRRARQSLLGRVTAVIPNNFFSLLALLAAIGPSVIQALRQSHGASETKRPRQRWLVPALIVGLTLLNYIINDVRSAQQNRLVMEKLDRLLAVGVRSPGE